MTTDNGRKAASAEQDGMKLFKFLSKEDAARLEGAGQGAATPDSDQTEETE